MTSGDKIAGKCNGSRVRVSSRLDWLFSLTSVKVACSVQAASTRRAHARIRKRPFLLHLRNSPLANFCLELSSDRFCTSQTSTICFSVLLKSESQHPCEQSPAFFRQWNLNSTTSRYGASPVGNLLISLAEMFSSHNYSSHVCPKCELPR